MDCWTAGLYLWTEYSVVLAPAGTEVSDASEGGGPQDTEEDGQEDQAVVQTEYHCQGEDLTSELWIKNLLKRRIK